MSTWILTAYLMLVYDHFQHPHGFTLAARGLTHASTYCMPVNNKEDFKSCNLQQHSNIFKRTSFESLLAQYHYFSIWKQTNKQKTL